MKINLVTLGCAKNLVDSERLIYQLQQNGHTLLHNADEFTDIVIINTCGFILDAKTESVETILQYAESKKEGFIDKLYVMGCLSQRYKESLKKEIPEVDAFFGVDDLRFVLQELNSQYHVGELYRRTIQTLPHYAYLKISEGCNRNCAFCAIPSIRGRQKSVGMDDLVRESSQLVQEGVKELILIAQDITTYGTDLYGSRKLPELLEKLCRFSGAEWIRLHYAYPLSFPADEVIALMKDFPNLCKYLDIPVQHINEDILRRMNRGHGSREVYEIIEKFRKEIPDVSLRTTLITGFPGESEGAYQELKKFVLETKFDRLGVFPYSHEEDTPAFKLKNDVSQARAGERRDELMAIQEQISLEKNLEKIGKKLKVIVDAEEGEFMIARSEYDSPEVDNEILISKNGHSLRKGEFYTATIIDALEFDLFGRIEK